MNKTDALQPIEDLDVVATDKPDMLAAQKKAIDAASVGSAVFHSPAAYLALHPKVAGYKR